MGNVIHNRCTIRDEMKAKSDGSRVGPNRPVKERREATPAMEGEEETREHIGKEQSSRSDSFKDQEGAVRTAFQVTAPRKHNCTKKLVLSWLPGLTL